jgi:predicted nucleic acid-binding protein
MRSMTGRIFIDSNIFLYTLDKADNSRRKIAKERLLTAADNNKIVISTQVINEIFAVATRKLGIEALSVKEFIRGLYDFDVVIISTEIIESAIDCSILHRLSYWDALMIAAGQAAKCDILWSEDLKHDAEIRGLKIQNPLIDV